MTQVILRWLSAANIEKAYIDLSEPGQNAVAGSFTEKLREERLRFEWFRNRSDGKIVIESWLRHDSETRSHLSLGSLSPERCKRASSTICPEASR